MPYAKRICGIYCITTPRGSQYVGSSCDIFSRWAGHRYSLRRRTHRSARLQAAWDKYGDKLAFSILEVCDRDELNLKEQEWIDRLRADLNTTPFVNNVYANPATREKLAAFHKSDEWRRRRSEIARQPRATWVAVDCSNGKSYPNIARAAEAFGVRISAIRYLSQTQRVGKLGVRFKLATTQWRDVVTAPEQRKITRAANGKTWSAEARSRQSATKKGRAVSVNALSSAIDASRRAVIGTHLITEQKLYFRSQREAANVVCPWRGNAASSEISNACRGRKKSAYGYRWEYIKGRDKEQAVNA